MPDVPAIQESLAGPSSSPPTRSVSPHVDGNHALRRPASHGRLAKLMVPGRSRSASIASQAETPVTAFADEGVSASGRSTPEQRWRSGKAATASLLANDAKYKKFAFQVEKALQTFESVNEWADFISFLSRLLKTLQTPHPPYAEIPKKLIVAKRLAQCLNPALPSGVHQRALDVYSHIFATIGVEGLKRDLLIWSSGILPFFQFAATSVRPILLKIYESYYLPLEEGLRPVTKAMILALLPGMEEETGDFFDNVLSLLTRVSKTVGPAFFLQNVFLVLISSPASRLSAVNFLSKRLPGAPDPSDHVDVGLVIRGVAAVLEDENSLARRGGLDLLLRVLPLNGALIKNAEEDDRRLLVRAAVGVVLQREISLSRRVYTWLLGKEESSEAQVAHFKQFGLDILASTLQAEMETAASEMTEDQRSFKVFLSLLDRWEIGSVLSERLAIPALETVKKAIDGAPSVREEFIMTASAIYDAIEPIIIWRTFFHALERHDTSLLRWTLAYIPQKDDEVFGIHIPIVLDHILQKTAVDWELADSLFHDIPPIAFDQLSAKHTIVSIYTSSVLPEETRANMPSVAYRIVSRVFDLSVNATCGDRLRALDMVDRLMESDSAVSTVDGPAWMNRLILLLTKTISFPVVDAIVTTALKATRSSFKPPVSIARPEHMGVLLDTLFRFLRADAAHNHRRAVELLWEYNKLAEIHALENVIARQMSVNLAKNRCAAMEAFGTLWRLTDDAMLPGEIFYVPMSLVLDAYRDGDPEIKGRAETWMRCNLTSYFRILDPLLARLLSSNVDVDYNVTVHQLRNIETLFKMGGQSLSRVCQISEVAKSTHPMLPNKAALFPNAVTYLDLVTDVLLGTLRQQARRSNRTSLLRVHAITLDVLELLIAEGDLSTASTRQLRAVVLEQLAHSTAQRQTTLQYQLLRLLQLAIGPPPKTHRRNTSVSEKRSSLDEDLEKHLVKVVIDGVMAVTNRPVLQHWVDFVLIIAPTLQPRSALLHLLCDAFSHQVRAAVFDLKEQSTSSGRSVTDAEVIMLLTGLERLLALSGPVIRKSEDGRASEGGSGILGLVSGVFIADAPDDKTKTYNLEYLVIALEALLYVWTVTEGVQGGNAARTFTSISTRNRQVLEKMFKTQTGAIVAGCVSIWASPREGVTDDAIFGSIDDLTPSAQRVIEIVSESIKQTRTVDTSDATMAFLEAYVSRLEAPIAVQIWGTMFGFSRDVLAAATTPSAKAQLYPLLRCLTVLARTVTTTSALEDRRLRRDLQEVYPRILDAVISNIAKVSDDVWPETETSNVYTFLATEVIPNLRSFLVDQDKIAAASSSISQNTILPALKQYKATPDNLRLIQELTRIPAATKTWRIAVGDAFNDGRFFGINPDHVPLWRPLINSLFDSDKERFSELLGRITAAPSANIFTNREQEMISRSSNLRRLSFVLLAADQNHYLTQLPAIQEKLVDILRTNVVSPRVHSEVYLCLRVIMCRIGAQHLTNFWPVILAELLRVFEGIMEEVPVDGSESLQLALAACKFLDLLLVIQSEDFQIHQWMFVTDTTDAVYPPEDFSAEAIMDTIAGILREHFHSKENVEMIQLEEAGKLRRPRLANVKAISSIRQLEPFFSRASIDTFEGVYRDAGVDWTVVEDGLNGEIFG